MATSKWAMSELDGFKTRIAAFEAEAGGLVQLYLVRRRDKWLHEALDKGDPLAVTLAAVCGEALHEMRYSRRRVHCLICERAFANEYPGAFLLWLPTAKTEGVLPHRNMVAQPICARCEGGTDRALLVHAVALFKKLFPKAEVVSEDWRGDG